MFDPKLPIKDYRIDQHRQMQRVDRELGNIGDMVESLQLSFEQFRVLVQEKRYENITWINSWLERFAEELAELRLISEQQQQMTPGQSVDASFTELVR